MPIDLELQKKAAQDELDALLSGQSNNLDSVMAGIQGKVQGSRDLSLGTGFASSLGIAAPTDTGRANTLLDAELKKKMASNKFGQSRDILNNKFSSLGKFQDQATTLRRATEGNARDVNSARKKQDFTASQDLLDRTTASKLQDIRNSMIDRSANLKNQYSEFQPGNPTVRMLATLGGVVGTSALLKHGLNLGDDTGDSSFDFTKSWRNSGFVAPKDFSTGYGGSGSTYKDLLKARGING